MGGRGEERRGLNILALSPRLCLVCLVSLDFFVLPSSGGPADSTTSLFQIPIPPVDFVGVSDKDACVHAQRPDSAINSFLFVLSIFCSEVRVCPVICTTTAIEVVLLPGRSIGSHE